MFFKKKKSWTCVCWQVLCVWASMCLYNALHVHREVLRGVVSMATAGHTLLRGCWTKARRLYHNLTLFNTLSSCHVFLCYALREKERVPTFINSYISLLPVKHRNRDLSAIFARLLVWRTLNRVEGDYKWLHHLRQKARAGWIFNASVYDGVSTLCFRPQQKWTVRWMIKEDDGQKQTKVKATRSPAPL